MSHAHVAGLMVAAAAVAWPCLVTELRALRCDRATRARNAARAAAWRAYHAHRAAGVTSVPPAGG